MAQRTLDRALAGRSCDRLPIAGLLPATGGTGRRAQGLLAPLRLSEPEEARTRPVGAGDLLGNHGERPPGLAVPGEAGLEDEHVMTLAPPFAHELRAGLEPEGARPREVSFAVHGLGELGKAALH